MADFIARLTPETAAALLSAAGVTNSSEEIQIIARDERWAVPIGREGIAWFLHRSWAAGGSRWSAGFYL
jgi:hypothetical protein